MLKLYGSKNVHSQAPDGYPQPRTHYFYATHAGVLSTGASVLSCEEAVGWHSSNSFEDSSLSGFCVEKLWMAFTCWQFYLNVAIL